MSSSAEEKEGAMSSSAGEKDGAMPSSAAEAEDISSSSAAKTETTYSSGAAEAGNISSSNASAADSSVKAAIADNLGDATVRRPDDVDVGAQREKVAAMVEEQETLPTVPAGGEVANSDLDSATADAHALTMEREGASEHTGREVSTVGTSAPPEGGSGQDKAPLSNMSNAEKTAAIAAFFARGADGNGKDETTDRMGVFMRYIDNDGSGTLENEEIERGLALLKFFDSNGEGTIDDIELARMTAFLKMMDTDGSGNLSADEIERVMRILASFDSDKSGALSEEEHARMMKIVGLFDSDGSGCLSAAEQSSLFSFIALLDSDNSGSLSADEIDRALAVSAMFDADGSGRLDVFEVSRLMTFLRLSDSDGSGHIDAEEMARMMMLASYFDSDGSKSMDAFEFSRMVSFLKEIDGDASGNISPAECATGLAILKIFDVDGGGRLDEGEYAAMMSALADFYAAETGKDGFLDVSESLHTNISGIPFDEIDTDGNEKVSLVEFMALASAKFLFDGADASGDGRLSMEEFRSLPLPGLEVTHEGLWSKFSLLESDTLAFADFYNLMKTYKLFLSLDTDGSESLTLGEIQGHAKELGINPGDLERILSADASISLDLNEFQNLLASIRAYSRMSRLAGRSLTWGDLKMLNFDRMNVNMNEVVSSHGQPDQGAMDVVAFYDLMTALSRFRSLDKDQSGALSPTEMEPLAARVGVLAPDLVAAIDGSHDGSVSLAEFVRMNMALNAFQRLDRDGSNVLDAGELGEYLEALGIDYQAVLDAHGEPGRDSVNFVTFYKLYAAREAAA